MAKAVAYEGHAAWIEKEGKTSQGPFPPLADVRKKLQVNWYRSPTPRGALRALSRRSDAQGLVQALGHLAAWGLTGYSVLRAWASGSWAATAATTWVHGTVGSLLVHGCHELGHGTVFATPLLNDIFLRIYSLLYWWDPHEYAGSHTYHHRYTEYAEGDRENLFPVTPSLEPLLLLQLFTVNLTGRTGRVFGKGGLLACVEYTVKCALGGVAADAGTVQHEWLSTLHADQPGNFARGVRWSRILVLFHGGVFAYAVSSRTYALVLVVNVHLFVGNWLAYFIGVTQHCGLKGSVADFRRNTRSVWLDPVTEFFYWRMNFHLEHHMFAGVPCYNLKKLHGLIEHDLPETKSVWATWAEMRAIHANQLKNPGYEHERPLPATANPAVGTATAPRGGGQATEGDIGDLAPAGLKVE